MLPGFIRIIGGTVNLDLMMEMTYSANGDSIKPHPGYNFRRRAFNIATIKVTTPIREKQINLKKITLAKKVPPMNTNCTITGWGKIESGPNAPLYPWPQTATVQLLEMKQCEKVFEQIPADTLCFGSTGVSVCLVGGQRRERS